MALPTPPPLTAEEYLAQERAATERHEFLNGRVFAMAGASLRHNVLVANLIITLGVQLRGSPCGTYSSDTRVKVSATGLYTYPDVVVVCGEPAVIARTTWVGGGPFGPMASPATQAERVAGCPVHGRSGGR